MSCCNKSKVLEEVRKSPATMPVIDVEALLKTFEGDEEFVVELMNSSLKTFPEYYESLEKSREHLKIAAVAHTLKGCAGSLACFPLQYASSDLEVYAKSSTRDSVEVMKEKIQVVSHEIERALESIKSHPIYRRHS